MSYLYRHPQYDARMEDWQRCRDCYEGSSAIKSAGTRYLPMLSPLQSTESYEAYRKSAIYVNAFGRTVSAMTGLVSRVAPRITAPVETADITRDGEPLPLFATDALRELLITGRVAIALDAIGGRVRWQRYAAEDILVWRTEPGYRDRLSMVVLRERDYAPVADSEFQLAEVSTLYVWRMTADGATVATVPEGEVSTGIPAGELATTATGEALREIPVTVIGTGDVRVPVDRPPLLDLAELALVRYILSAQHHRALFWGAIPQPYISTDGQLPDDLSIGGGSIWKLPAGATAGMVQTNGSGLTVGQSNLNDLTQQIANMGARLITDTHTAPETAEAARIQSAGDAATLSGIVTGLDTGVARALRHHTEWERRTGDISYTSNREYFDPKIDSNELQALIGVYQAGGMSLETLLSALQDGMVLPADVDIEQERERITREQSNGTQSELTKTEYDGLDTDGLRALYVADGDNYRLDVEDDSPSDPPNDGDRLSRVESLLASLVNRKPEKPKPADADLTVRVAELESQLEGERAAARAEKMNAVIGREATKLGVLPAAVDDVIARASGAGFALADDGSVATESGTTITAYVEGMRKTNGYLFRQPTGSQQPGSMGSPPKPTKYVESMTDDEFLANAEAIAKGETVTGTVN